MKKFETMNTQRKVNKMLFSKERVELAKISDLEKLNNEAKEIIRDVERLGETLQSQRNKWNQANKQYKLDIASAKSIFKAHNNLIDDLQGQLKDLGLVPNDVPQLKEAIRIGSDLRAVANDMEKYSDL